MPPRDPEPDDDDARRRFVRDAVARYQRPLYRFARRQLGSDERANDAVQETFLRLWERGRVETDAHARRWLYVTCRRLCVDARRRAGARGQTADAPPDALAALGGGPARDLETRELLARFAAHYMALSERDQAVLRLKLDDGLSYREIAEVLELTVSHVGWILHTTLTRIRAELADRSKPRHVIAENAE